MKKLVTIVCAMLMMAAFAIPTFAATTKDDIIAELKAGVQVGDKTKAIPEKYIDVAEKFFAANELTDEQLATALTEVKEAKELWASTGETEFKNIPADVQKQLQNKAAAAAKKVGATLTFDGKTISVVDAQGRTYSVLAKSNPIKPTGADYTMLIVVSAAVLGVLGSVVVISRKNKLIGDC